MVDVKHKKAARQALTGREAMARALPVEHSSGRGTLRGRAVKEEPGRRLRRRLAMDGLPRVKFLLIERWLTQSSLWLPELARLADQLRLRLEISYVDMHQGGGDGCSIHASPRIDDSQWEMVLRKHSEDVDGMLLFGCFDEQQLQIVSRMPIPYIVLGDLADDMLSHRMRVHSVTTDKIHMGSHAVQELVARGHERIGFFCGKYMKGGWNHQWLQGYQLGLNNCRLPFAAEHVRVMDFGNRLEVGGGAAAYFASLDNPPTAYVTPTAVGAAEFKAALWKRRIDLRAEQIIFGGHRFELATLGLEDCLCMTEPVEQLAHHALSLITRLIQRQELPPTCVRLRHELCYVNRG